MTKPWKEDNLHNALRVHRQSNATVSIFCSSAYILTCFISCSCILSHYIYELYRRRMNNNSNLWHFLYFQIKKFETMESDEERIKAGKDIYDQFIMKELLSQSHVSNLSGLKVTNMALFLGLANHLHNAWALYDILKLLMH